jgi:Gamma-glutamyl cyclotransferase, AIG2-like
VRLFLYGTLLDPAALAARSGDPTLPKRCRSAVLHGWRRVTLVGRPWPTLRRCANAVITGKVVTAGAAALRRLTVYEGPEYRLRLVVVEPRTPAWAWIAAGGTRSNWCDRRAVSTVPRQIAGRGQP